MILCVTVLFVFATNINNFYYILRPTSVALQFSLLYNVLFKGFPLMTSLISSRSRVSYFSSASANRRCSTAWLCNTFLARSYASYKGYKNYRGILHRAEQECGIHASIHQTIQLLRDTSLKELMGQSLFSLIPTLIMAAQRNALMPKLVVTSKFE